MTGLGETYTCAACGHGFVKTTSDEEAMTEAESLWNGEDLADGVEVVCDDCWKQMVPWAMAQAPELFRPLPQGPE